jgi:hypothetical protein
MIEFTLSKLNLLVFVLAVTAIVIFFMNTVNSNLRTRQAYELVYKTGQEIKVGFDNPSYCSVKYIDIPKKIKLNTGISSVFNINYILNISVHDNLSTDTKKIVLAILDAKKEKIFAAYDLDFNGEVVLYEWEFNDSLGKYEYFIINNSDSNSIDLQTNKKDSIDHTLILAKKIKEGVPTIHLFSCGKVNNIPGCSNKLSKINSDDLITHLVDEKQINCICLSSTIALNYTQATPSDKINACQ